MLRGWWVGIDKKNKKGLSPLLDADFRYWTASKFNGIFGVVDNASYLFGGVNMAGDKTVYAFHVTPEIWLTLTIIAAVFAGIFASFGYCLFGLFDC